MLQDILKKSSGAIESLACLEVVFNQAVGAVVDCLSSGHKLLVCGNGGSAAEASHLATELVVRFVHDRRPYPAIALSDSGGTLTAAGNDYGFDEVFARQVRALGQVGDVLVALSTSGRSANIVRALRGARELGLTSVAFLGRDGGEARGLATIELIVPNQETARIQEAHLVLIHALCEAIEPRLGP